MNQKWTCIFDVRFYKTKILKKLITLNNYKDSFNINLPFSIIDLPKKN